MNRDIKQHLAIAFIVAFGLVASLNTYLFLISPEGAGYNEKTIPFLIEAGLLAAVFINPAFYIILIVTFTIFYYVGRRN